MFEMTSTREQRVCAGFVVRGRPKSTQNK